jgi:hypothetical protein
MIRGTKNHRADIGYLNETIKMWGVNLTKITLFLHPNALLFSNFLENIEILRGNTVPEQKNVAKILGGIKNGLCQATPRILMLSRVEPTNNHAERCLRRLVIWRKKYFCTKSDYGSQYVARSASIITTCKLNGKSSFEFFTTLMRNYFAGKPTSTRLLMA